MGCQSHPIPFREREQVPGGLARLAGHTSWFWAGLLICTIASVRAAGVWCVLSEVFGGGCTVVFWGVIYRDLHPGVAIGSEMDWICVGRKWEVVVGQVVGARGAQVRDVMAFSFCFSLSLVSFSELC
jgi:hypothetical protein